MLPLLSSPFYAFFLSSSLSLRSRFLSDAHVLLTYRRRTHMRRHHHHCEAAEIRDRPCPHPGLNPRSSRSPGLNPLSWRLPLALRPEAISQKEYPSSWCSGWTAQHIPRGQRRRAFPAARDRLPGFLAPCPARCIPLAAPRHDRMDAWPPPTLGPCQPRLDLASLRPMPVPFPPPLPPVQGMRVAGRGRGLPPVEGGAPLGGTRSHAGQQLWAHPTTFWSVSQGALPPGPGPRRGLFPCGPPSGTRLAEPIPGRGSPPTGEGRRRPGGLPTPARQGRRGQAAGVGPRVVSAPRQATAGDLPQGHRGWPRATPALAGGRGQAVVVLCARWAQRAAGAALFWCGGALTTGRRRPPLRVRPAARGDGAGRWAWRYPGACQAAGAAWAGSRGEARGVRHVGAWGAGAAARRRRAAAPSGGLSPQRCRPQQAAGAPGVARRAPPPQEDGPTRPSVRLARGPPSKMATAWRPPRRAGVARASWRRPRGKRRWARD